MKKKLLILLPVVCAPPAFFRVARADTIALVSGKQITGVEIVEARWDSVQYKVGARTTSVNGAEVLEIERDSRLLRALRQAVKVGDHARVLREVERIEKGPAGQWEKNEAAYRKGEGLLASGKPKEAATAFEAYLQNAKEMKDWWEPHAIYGVGLAALEQGQPRTALLRFKELESYGTSWSERAMLGRGEAYLIDNKPLEARQTFNQVRQRSRYPVLKEQANVGYAKVLIQQKQYAQAIRDLEASFFKSARKPGGSIYTPARAEATFLMGEAYGAQGGNQNLERAEIWYLKTAALYQHYTKIYRNACQRLQQVYVKLNHKERAEDWGRRLEAVGG